MINALPLYVMADASDVGAECDNPHHDGHYRASRLLIYDRHPGGVGIARQAAGLFRELLVAALELVEGCGCGCGGGGGGGSADATATRLDQIFFSGTYGHSIQKQFTGQLKGGAIKC